MRKPLPRRIPDKGFALTLADGTRLALRAGDEEALQAVEFFARVTRLEPVDAPLPPGTRPLVAEVRGNGAPGPAPLPAEADTEVVCTLDRPAIRRKRYGRRGRNGAPERTIDPAPGEKSLWLRLARLSAAIGRETHPRGGVLLHSGLARIPDRILPAGEREDPGGILLAGRSGVGKSTASRRLPAPWRSRCDDATLVVRDAAGRYRAHPMPTWSRFFGLEAGDGSDTWDLEHAEFLRAIFILEQGDGDRAEPLGPGHAVSLLAELARQTSTQFLRGQPPVEIASFNLRCFDNICALARAVPAYLLRVSLDGVFWDEIGRVLSV